MLSSYCFPSQHTVLTRYVTNLNYKLPIVHSLRGQSSIKFSDPKAWYQIPLHLKEIAFRKPFSQKLKEHLLRILQEKNNRLPKESSFIPAINQKYNNTNSLKSIFEQNDDDIIFYGFETRSLEEIFENDGESSEFMGFAYHESNLELLFVSDEENETFIEF